MVDLASHRTPGWHPRYGAGDHPRPWKGVLPSPLPSAAPCLIWGTPGSTLTHRSTI